MTVQVEISADMEAKLQNRAAAAGQDVASFVRKLLSDELAAETPDNGQAQSHEEFSRRLRATIDGDGIRCGTFDDSRESIYDGCGE
jgi:hypothetical protein